MRGKAGASGGSPAADRTVVQPFRIQLHMMDGDRRHPTGDLVFRGVSICRIQSLGYGGLLLKRRTPEEELEDGDRCGAARCESEEHEEEFLPFALRLVADGQPPRQGDCKHGYRRQKDNGRSLASPMALIGHR